MLSIQQMSIMIQDNLKRIEIAEHLYLSEAKQSKAFHHISYNLIKIFYKITSSNDKLNVHELDVHGLNVHGQDVHGQDVHGLKVVLQVELLRGERLVQPKVLQVHKLDRLMVQHELQQDVLEHGLKVHELVHELMVHELVHESMVLGHELMVHELVQRPNVLEHELVLRTSRQHLLRQLGQFQARNLQD